MIVFLDSFDKKRQIKADLYFKVLNHAFWTSEHSIFFPKNSHTHTFSDPRENDKNDK